MNNALTVEQSLQCLCGTFAAEDMSISAETQLSLRRMSAGQVSMDELLHAAIMQFSTERK